MSRRKPKKGNSMFGALLVLALLGSCLSPGDSSNNVSTAETTTEYVAQETNAITSEDTTEITTEEIAKITTEKATEEIAEITTEETTEGTTEITTEENTTETDEEMVWIPKTGKKYHSNYSCGNMKNPRQVTLTEAQRRRYTACKKCYK